MGSNKLKTDMTSSVNYQEKLSNAQTEGWAIMFCK